MNIKRGILQSFDSSSYTASVLLFEATSYALTGIAVANHIDGTSAINGALCAILFFNEHNPQDAVILAIFANGSSGYPIPAPGRVTYVAGYRQINGDSIAANTSTSYRVSGGTTNIPATATGILYKAFFSSPTVNAYLQIAPHAADPTAYATIGNLSAANATLNANGLLPLDSSGSIDIKANVGTCTVTLYTYGYTN